MTDMNDIRKALERISPFVHKTPLIHSNSFSRLTGAEVYLKAENLQKTGSFKVRGAFNKLIGLKENVIAASMGNHAQGVAFAAATLGLKARVVMPLTAPIIKQEATKGYGAEVILHGRTFKEALDYALEQEGCVFVHAFDDEEIIAGQGTIGIEIAEELKGMDAILVPVGGGGLISGISIAVKDLSPKTEIIGVQTVSAPSAYESFHSGKIIEAVPQPTIADGIAVGKTGVKTFDIIKWHVDDIVTVTEEAIAMSVLLFLERKKLVVEGAGAVALAAMLEDRERFRGRRVAFVVSGGNIDFTLIDRIIHKGMASSGRIGVFRVVVDDIPGTLHRLTGIISEKNGNIINVVHDRLAQDIPIGRTMVIFTIETKGTAHLAEIKTAVTEAGFAIV